MIRLFRRFDSFFYRLTVVRLILFIISVFCSNIFINIIRFLFRIARNYFTKFFSSTKLTGFNKFCFMYLNTILVFLFLVNLTRIFPFLFSWTSQVRLVIFASLGVWLGLNIFYAVYNLKGFIAHCVPEGTPIYLTWLLFLIELIRRFIRPITLTVRLVANITAGHLLINLLAGLVITVKILSPLYILLNSVELFVGLIQAYIFATIASLYYSEVN